MSTTSERAKDIYDGAFFQAMRDDADDPQLVAAIELAAVAWDELANSLSRGMTIPANPYRVPANALVVRPQDQD